MVNQTLSLSAPRQSAKLGYRSQEEFIFALAEAMRSEYRAIVAAGFILQIDDARLPTTTRKVIRRAHHRPRRMNSRISRPSASSAVLNW